MFSTSNSVGNTNIWKYLFSSPSSVECYEPSIQINMPGTVLLINTNEIFILSRNQTSIYNLFMLKVTFGSSITDWNYSIVWPSFALQWVKGMSESILSQNSSMLYVLFTFGIDTNSYAQFINLDVQNGSMIGSRYISNIIWESFSSITSIDKYIASIIVWGSVSQLFIYDSSSSTILTSQFNGILKSVQNDLLYSR